MTALKRLMKAVLLEMASDLSIKAFRVAFKLFIESKIYNHGSNIVVAKNEMGDNMQEAITSLSGKVGPISGKDVVTNPRRIYDRVVPD